MLDLLLSSCGLVGDFAFEVKYLEEASTNTNVAVEFTKRGYLTSGILPHLMLAHLSMTTRSGGGTSREVNSCC